MKITLTNSQLDRIVAKFDFDERLDFSNEAKNFQTDRIEEALLFPDGSCVDLYYHAVFYWDDGYNRNLLGTLYLDLDAWSHDGGVYGLECDGEYLQEISDRITMDINEKLKS